MNKILENTFLKIALKNSNTHPFLIPASTMIRRSVFVGDRSKSKSLRFHSLVKCPFWFRVPDPIPKFMNLLNLLKKVSGSF